MLEKMLALQNKRKKEGGFTLVELIVVLVILAILAALLIPALTGYIEKAHQKSAIAETRQLVMAAQTIYDEHYGEDKNINAWNDNWNDATLTLAELKTKGTLANGGITVSNGSIASVTWTSNTYSKACTYSGGNYTFQ